MPFQFPAPAEHAAVVGVMQDVQTNGAAEKFLLDVARHRIGFRIRLVERLQSSISTWMNGTLAVDLRF
jgi:hypothetical protein